LTLHHPPPRLRVHGSNLNGLSQPPTRGNNRELIVQHETDGTDFLTGLGQETLPLRGVQISNDFTSVTCDG
jgi:hypothetical protein